MSVAKQNSIEEFEKQEQEVIESMSAEQNAPGSHQNHLKSVNPRGNPYHEQNKSGVMSVGSVSDVNHNQ